MAMAVALSLPIDQQKGRRALRRRPLVATVGSGRPIPSHSWGSMRTGSRDLVNDALTLMA
jgi:hypothetical protein